MTVLTQCFMVGLGFAVGLALLIVALHLLQNPAEKRRHAASTALFIEANELLRERNVSSRRLVDIAEELLVIQQGRS